MRLASPAAVSPSKLPPASSLQAPSARPSVLALDCIIEEDSGLQRSCHSASEESEDCKSLNELSLRSTQAPSEHPSVLSLDYSVDDSSLSERSSPAPSEASDVCSMDFNDELVATQITGCPAALSSLDVPSVGVEHCRQTALHGSQLDCRRPANKMSMKQFLALHGACL